MSQLNWAESSIVLKVFCVICATVPLCFVVDDWLFSFSSQVNAADGLPFKAEDNWRSTRCCGVNALYALLRLHGVDVSYKQIAEKLPIDSGGASLLDMKRVAASLGVSAKVVRMRPDDLVGRVLPAIALLEQSESDTGHYVVVVARSSGKVELIDGTSGMVLFRALPEFVKTWNGHAMLIIPNSIELYWSSLIVPLLVACCGGGAIVRRRYGLKTVSKDRVLRD